MAFAIEYITSMRSFELGYSRANLYPEIILLINPLSLTFSFMKIVDANRLLSTM